MSFDLGFRLQNEHYGDTEKRFLYKQDSKRL